MFGHRKVIGFGSRCIKRITVAIDVNVLVFCFVLRYYARLFC